jgi:hypothetical protein
VQLVEDGVLVPERVVAHGHSSACVVLSPVPKRIPAPERRDGCACENCVPCATQEAGPWSVRKPGDEAAYLIVLLRFGYIATSLRTDPAP